MKTLVLIGVTLLCSIGFSQMSQSGSSLEYEFSNTTLEAKHIEAFENRAKQKVHDFCNYIQLISDKNYDEKFRAHSKNTALTLFYSPDCTIADSVISGEQVGMDIETYFSEIYQTKYQKIIGEASELVVSKDLSVTESGNYLGTISFLYQLKCYNENEQLVASYVVRKVVDVNLSRKAKAFGDNEKVIWVVSLCDINTK